MQTVWKKVICSVAEAIGRFACDDTGEQKMREIPVEGDLSKTDDDANTRQGLDLSGEMGGTVAYLLRLRFIVGRRTADNGGDPGVAQLEAVVAVDGAGLAGQTELVQYRIHEVAGAVAGERASGAVRSVRARSEAKNEDAGARITETGNGARPVSLVDVSTAFSLSNALAVLAQPRTEIAGDDRFADLLQERGRALDIEGGHCIQ